MQYDAIVIGAGLAGLTVTRELIEPKKVDQEPMNSMGGQVFWSFGGGGMHGYRSLEGTFVGSVYSKDYRLGNI